MRGWYMRRVFVLFFVLIIVETQAQHAYDADQVIEKRFTYNTLSTYKNLIFDEFVDAEFPAGQSIKEILKTNISLKSKIRLAEALLYRNHLEDIKNANVIIQRICKLQNVECGSINFGVWLGGNEI